MATKKEIFLTVSVHFLAVGGNHKGEKYQL